MSNTHAMSELVELDYHGDHLLIDDAIIRRSRPSAPHLSFYNARTKQYAYAKLSDIKIEHKGRHISYIRYLKLVGSPTVY
ncbi:hypothetical protein [Microbacterium sp. JAI119]|uniref:hypothetical protein n=1 Tax=Microbacterium sp. JAI119 TaxID=2723062 RepID=UPI0015CB7F8A|nr:hypothetical protein [Microbacterium sp. JAI119]NYF28097.1 hypothetical protein [Microbacterium sp. JAI119]